MTGRYRIPLFLPGADVPYNVRTAHARVAHIRYEAGRTWRKRWSNFVRTCESLAADGLDYAVTFVLTGDDPHILITASGTATPKRKPAARPRYGMVQAVKPEECRTRALEAAWFLPENAGKRNANTTHWKRRGARYAELNRMAGDELRAEVEFWRDMELMSGQREHFKPGMPEQPRWEDDEVAA